MLLWFFFSKFICDGRKLMILREASSLFLWRIMQKISNSVSHMVMVCGDLGEPVISIYPEYLMIVCDTK